MIAAEDQASKAIRGKMAKGNDKTKAREGNRDRGNNH